VRFRGGTFAAVLLLLPGAAWAHDDLSVTLERLAAAARTDVEARLEHAELSRLAGDPGAARRDLDTLAVTDPRLPGAFLLRAVLALDDAKPSEVVRQVERFLAVSDGQKDAVVAQAFTLRAQAHAALGDTTHALEDWDRAFALAPSADAALTRARMADTSRRDARPALGKALARFPNEPSLTFLAADLDARAGDVDAAVARLEAFAKTCAQPAAVLARAGDLYAAAGRTLDAEARWSDALAHLENARTGSAELTALHARLTGLLAGGQP